MEEDSKFIKDEFNNEFELVKKIDKKGNKLKTMIINVSFIASFIFVLYGAIVSYQKYIDKKNGNNNHIVSKINY